MRCLFALSLYSGLLDSAGGAPAPDTAAPAGAAGIAGAVAADVAVVEVSLDGVFGDADDLTLVQDIDLIAFGLNDGGGQTGDEKSPEDEVFAHGMPP